MLWRIRFIQRFSVWKKRKISDGSLVAITLMIAESDPVEKDIIVNLVINLLTLTYCATSNKLYENL